MKKCNVSAENKGLIPVIAHLTFFLLFFPLMLFLRNLIESFGILVYILFEGCVHFFTFP